MRTQNFFLFNAKESNALELVDKYGLTRVPIVCTKVCKCVYSSQESYALGSESDSVVVISF